MKLSLATLTLNPDAPENPPWWGLALVVLTGLPFIVAWAWFVWKLRRK